MICAKLWNEQFCDMRSLIEKMRDCPLSVLAEVIGPGKISVSVLNPSGTKVKKVGRNFKKSKLVPLIGHLVASIPTDLQTRVRNARWCEYVHLAGKNTSCGMSRGSRILYHHENLATVINEWVSRGLKYDKSSPSLQIRGYRNQEICPMRGTSLLCVVSLFEYNEYC